MADTDRHQSVLLKEALDALAVSESGRYVDGTFGRGGHSGALLELLGPEGRLLAIDRDLAAIEYGRRQFADEERLLLEQGPFSNLETLVEGHDWMGRVDGILLDLGVSSPQLDTPERGFSFMHEGPLDMRMDTTTGVSAADWLANAEVGEIAKVLKGLGEERFAKRIARAIVAAREEVPLLTTQQLVAVIEKANPVREPGRHPATRSFQAIRIFINKELEELQSCLEQSLRVLAPGGRLAVISFHSLEDRIVKRFIRDNARGEQFPRGVPVTQDQVRPKLHSIGKAIRPSAQEIEVNPRARSAVLRVAERPA